ncbi:hypothetical protein CDAR_58931 [Caerostris darwini]|uniref:Uncharacterized protein n=1 Tax=Caerostris darwini TaxID=1538125 RepID=A0AAV4X242_9ARAC|nr:hypothetical protein CDAR_58931 [Caerostris darwini]
MSFRFLLPFVVLGKKKIQEASSVNCSKMPTANTEEELILAGIIAFHFKKLKCRYRRSPRGGIAFEKLFLPGRPGNTFLIICSQNCRTNGGSTPQEN